MLADDSPDILYRLPDLGIQLPGDDDHVWRDRLLPVFQYEIRAGIEITGNHDDALRIPVFQCYPATCFFIEMNRIGQDGIVPKVGAYPAFCHSLLQLKPDGLPVIEHILLAVQVIGKRQQHTIVHKFIK